MKFLCNQDELFKPLEVKVSSDKSKARHDRALYVEDLANLTKRTFISVLGQTKHLDPLQIRDIYQTAIKWKTNPAALANKLIKASRVVK